jgi:LAS superfamily LD-carboxypeptidase LdcB
MITDAKAQGVKIGITDSYRSYTEQVDVARRKGLYSQGGLAAKPGTSEHGWGMATDLDLNNKAQAWMRANGEKYGFVENTPREPWHWAFKPKSL